MANAEGGPDGTFNEALFCNLVPETIEDNLARYDQWGGVETFPHYAWGWTWAGNTPFRRWKRETHRGGVTEPCVISWPAGMRRGGEVRTQYFEMNGHRSIYREGWRAVCPSERINLSSSEPDRLSEMIELWYDEAERFGVLPIAGLAERSWSGRRPASATAGKGSCSFPEPHPCPSPTPHG